MQRIGASAPARPSQSLLLIWHCNSCAAVLAAQLSVASSLRPVLPCTFSPSPASRLLTSGSRIRCLACLARLAWPDLPAWKVGLPAACLLGHLAACVVCCLAVCLFAFWLPGCLAACSPCFPLDWSVNCVTRRSRKLVELVEQQRSSPCPSSGKRCFFSVALAGLPRGLPSGLQSLEDHAEVEPLSLRHRELCRKAVGAP